MKKFLYIASILFFIQAASAQGSITANTLLEENLSAIYEGVGGGGGVIALRFDDGDTAAYNYVFQELLERNLTAGFAFNFGQFGGSGYMSKAQATTTQLYGIEPMNHSKSHSTLSTTTTANFLIEVKEALDSLTANRLMVDAFVQPGTWTGTLNFDNLAKLNNSFGSIIRQYHGAFHGYTGANNYFTAPMGNRWNIALLPGDVSLTTLVNYVTHIVQTRTMAEVLFHAYHLGAPTYPTRATFESFLDTIVYYKNKYNLKVLNPTAAMFAKIGEESTNLLQDGSFEQSDSTNWHDWWPNSAPGIDTNTVRTGSKSASVNSTDYLTTFLPVAKYRSFKITGYARSKDSTTSSARIKIAYYASNTTIRDENFTVTNNAWTKCEMNFALPTYSTEYACIIRLFIQSSLFGVVLWDDVKIEKI